MVWHFTIGSAVWVLELCEVAGKILMRSSSSSRSRRRRKRFLIVLIRLCALYLVHPPPPPPPHPPSSAPPSRHWPRPPNKLSGDSHAISSVPGHSLGPTNKHIGLVTVTYFVFIKLAVCVSHIFDKYMVHLCPDIITAKIHPSVF